MSIMLTEKAAGEVKKIIADQKLNAETVLRIGVAGGGCSGFQYSLGFDTAWDPKVDTKSDQHGVPVVASNAAAYWQALRASGIDETRSNAGVLFAEH